MPKNKKKKPKKPKLKWVESKEKPTIHQDLANAFDGMMTALSPVCGWSGGGSFHKQLTAARNHAVSLLPRRFMLVLESKGLVVVDRKMMREFLELHRAIVRQQLATDDVNRIAFMELDEWK